MDRLKNVLSLFMVIIMIFFICPNKVQGNENRSYETVRYNPAVGFHRYPWQDFNPRKRTETEERNNQGGYDEKALDGEVVFGTMAKDTDKPIIFTHEYAGDATKRTSSDDNKMAVSNDILMGYAIKYNKLLYGRVPATYWPSTL